MSGGTGIDGYLTMADWNIKVTELVRELRRRTARLKGSIDERRQVVNVQPINDRRQNELFVSKPAPTEYQWILTAESGPLEGMRYAVTAPAHVEVSELLIMPVAKPERDT